jgi:hypothetical protein
MLGMIYLHKRLSSKKFRVRIGQSFYGQAFHEPTPLCGWLRGIGYKSLWGGQFQVVRMLIRESPNSMACVSACIISEYWRGASWTFTSQHEMTLLTYIFLILIYLSKVAFVAIPTAKCQKHAARQATDHGPRRRNSDSTELGPCLPFSFIDPPPVVGKYRFGGL